MTVIVPATNLITLELGQGKYLNLGSGSLSLGGSGQSYTIGAWIYLNSVSGIQTIISLYGWQPAPGFVLGEYMLRVEDGKVHAYRSPASPSLVSKKVLEPNIWYYVTMVYDSSNLQLLLYIDANLEAYGTYNNEPSVTNVNTLIGANYGQVSGANVPQSFLNGQLYSVYMWNTALDQAHIQDHIVVDPNPAIEPMLAYFDFARLPSADISGNNHAISWQGNPQSLIEMPGMSLQKTAYINCGTSADLSFPGTQSYTLEGWIYPTDVSGEKCILAKYNGGVGVAEYLLSINQGKLQSFRQGMAQPLVSNTTLQANQWYYVTTTYNGSTKTLSLYINGLLDGTPVTATSSMAAYDLSLLIGARYNQSQPTGFFQGFIQSIRLWNVANSQAQIQQWMYGIASNQPNVIADYALSYATPEDITGHPNHPLSLQNGAVLGNVQISVPPTSTINPQVPDRHAPAPALQIAPSPFQELVDALPPGARDYQPPPFEIFSDAHIALMVQERAESLATTISPAARQATLQEYETWLRDMITRVQTDSASLGLPDVRVERDGEYYVLRNYTPDGVEELLRVHESEVDPVVLWWTTFIYTTVSGVLGIFGVSIPGALASKIYTLMFGNQTVYQALLTLKGAITVGASITAVIGVATAVVGQGLLLTVLKWALSQYWTIFSLLISLLLWLNPTLQTTVTALRIQLLALNLINQIKNYPHTPALDAGVAPATVTDYPIS
jgi:hypothetical protein